MCDQDHFETDRQEYEALGLVTRKRFGVMLGAGIAMMLPRVANAVTVTESVVDAPSWIEPLPGVEVAVLLAWVTVKQPPADASVEAR